MLYLIGLGLCEDNLSLQGLKALKESNKVYAEFYTAPNVFNLSSLEKKINQLIEILSRKQVEEKFFTITEDDSQPALLVPGDPLIATTHFEIYKQAKEREMEVQVIHAPSIYSAVAETGLSLYKFGRTTTLPQAQGDFLPSSPYDFALKNFNNGMHTLILLDKEMEAVEALNILEELESDCEERLFVDSRQLLVVERLGADDQLINYDQLSKLKGKEYGATPHSLILPADLSHKEREYLNLRESN